MSIVKAIIMGIVQGATEFLPISSSGHLVIFSKVLGLELEHGVLFEVLLHVGTLLAVFLVYYKDIILLIKEGFGILVDIPKGKIDLEKSPYRKMVLLIITASIPTAIMGLFLEDYMERLFGSLLSTGIALLITGALLFLSDKIIPGKKQVEDMKYRNALVIGIFQGIAITPGISRSGSTIVGGLLNGLDKEFVIKFSFLISIPAITGAALLNLIGLNAEELKAAISIPYLTGMAASALVGFVCIKALIVMLKNQKFHLFSYYCWVVGLLAIVGSFML